MALGPEAPAASGGGKEARRKSGGGKGRQSDEHADDKGGKGSRNRKSDVPDNSNDRFAVLAPSREEASARQEGKKGGKGGKGSVADRMRKSKDEESAGSVADRMKKPSQSDWSPASDDKDEGAHRNRDEVWTEIHDIVGGNSCLQQSDFDYRIRQHLHAILGNGGREKLHQAVIGIQTATAKKTRADVRNWPAYLVKLLKKFDDDVAWKDREARAKERVDKARAESLVSDSASPSVSTVSPDRDSKRELDEEEDWLAAMSSDKDQWLNDLAAADLSNQQSPPPTQLEIPSPDRLCEMLSPDGHSPPPTQPEIPSPDRLCEIPSPDLLCEIPSPDRLLEIPSPDRLLKQRQAPGSLQQHSEGRPPQLSQASSDASPIERLMQGYVGRADDLSLEASRMPPRQPPPQAPPPQAAPLQPPLQASLLESLQAAAAPRGAPLQPPMQQAAAPRGAQRSASSQQLPKQPPMQDAAMMQALQAAVAGSGSTGPMQLPNGMQAQLRPSQCPPMQPPMGLPGGPTEAQLNAAHYAHGAGRLHHAPPPAHLSELDLQAQKLHQQLQQLGAPHQAYSGQGPGQYPGRTVDPMMAPRTRPATQLDFSLEAWAAFARSPPQPEHY